jgi:hypothetical protein
MISSSCERVPPGRCSVAFQLLALNHTHSPRAGKYKKALGCKAFSRFPRGDCSSSSRERPALRHRRALFGHVARTAGGLSVSRLSDVLRGRICLALNKGSGGEGGIRTHGALPGTPHFECGTFDHSATSPGAVFGSFLEPPEVEGAIPNGVAAVTQVPIGGFLSRSCPGVQNHLGAAE